MFVKSAAAPTSLASTQPPLMADLSIDVTETLARPDRWTATQILIFACFQQCLRREHYCTSVNNETCNGLNLRGLDFETLKHYPRKYRKQAMFRLYFHLTSRMTQAPSQAYSIAQRHFDLKYT